MSNVFSGKYGLITSRDLFKWAARGAAGYQALAEDGFLLLGERIRTAPERALVLSVLERVFNVKVLCVMLWQRLLGFCGAAFLATGYVCAVAIVADSLGLHYFERRSHFQAAGCAP